MDVRVRNHAEIIADHSTEIDTGDNVIVRAPREAQPLVEALYEVIGTRGASPATTWLDSRAYRAYMCAADPESFGLPDHRLAFLEATDVFIDIKAARNLHELSDIPPETRAARSRVTQPLFDAQLETRRVLTQFPAPGAAQKAEMSTPAYQDFVWSAVNKDWDAQRDYQQQLVDILDAGNEVRIRAGEMTDIRMDIANNPVKNDAAEDNLPGGEVSTAPVPESVQGEVRFDKPVLIKGHEVLDAFLAFEDGEVSAFEADKNEDVLASLLETDEGASRLGELGIGMNRDIDQFTYNMLFDEKMGNTVHMALGRAYEETVDEGNERNDSAVHQDMIVDMSEDSVITVDGEVIQRDGSFIFEEEFEMG